MTPHNEAKKEDIASDIAEHGMMLSGGGGNIKNLDKLIKKRTDMDVIIAENAFEAVAQGTGMSLENPEKLRLYAQSGKKR